MNLIDMLLSSDIEKIERPTKEVEIKRLSEMFGTPFVILCKALTFDKHNEIQNENLKMDIGTQKVEMDIPNTQLETVLNGVFNVSDGTRFFSNKNLHEKFKVHTSKDLIKKLLLGGEIQKVASVIDALGGYGENTVEDVKGLSEVMEIQD